MRAAASGACASTAGQGGGLERPARDRRDRSARDRGKRSGLEYGGRGLGSVPLTAGCRHAEGSAARRSGAEARRERRLYCLLTSSPHGFFTS